MQSKPSEDRSLAKGRSKASPSSSLGCSMPAKTTRASPMLYAYGLISTPNTLCCWTSVQTLRGHLHCFLAESARYCGEQTTGAEAGVVDAFAWTRIQKISHHLDHRLGRCVISEGFGLRSGFFHKAHKGIPCHLPISGSLQIESLDPLDEHLDHLRRFVGEGLNDAYKPLQELAEVGIGSVVQRGQYLFPKDVYKLRTAKIAPRGPMLIPR